MVNSIHVLLAVAFISTGLCTAQDAEVDARERAVLELLLEKGVITQAEFDERTGATEEDLLIEGPARTVKEHALEPLVPQVSNTAPPTSSTEALSGAIEDAIEPTRLMSRNVLRAGWGVADQDLTSSAPLWEGSGHTVFAEAFKSLSERSFGFAEFEEFSSSNEFFQTAIIAGAGWDTPINDRLAAHIKCGFSHFSSERLVEWSGEVEEDKVDTLFIGGGVRYLLSDEFLAEFELWKGREGQGGSSMRLNYLTSGRYGVFLESLSRNDYTVLRFGVSMFR